MNELMDGDFVDIILDSINREIDEMYNILFIILFISK